ncbi:MAG TPA: dTMP kinase [Casimicrobium huifangae]|nr:dTMP kinase [Casimicrobium huifangae]HQA34783.1 dTMP kinase [Casimicrobium huifangae]HQD64515.1 dTMP kinase [Casimicrobium huifangae]
MRGKFITFEGIDGAGKSTHIESVRAFLAARGKTVVMTREPGGTELGEAIRGLFLDRSMSPASEALLVFAARREHLERVVWPALERGDWVLCDRFTDATFAYQGGGREMGFDRIQVLADWVHPAFAPDLTLLFDLPPDAAHDRVAHRGELDRIESEVSDFHVRVRDAYLRRAAAEPDRIKVLSSDQSKETVRSRVLACAMQLLGSAE